MSVEELVKRLRDMGGGDHAVKTCHDAADKLEELAAENEATRQDIERYIQINSDLLTENEQQFQMLANQAQTIKAQQEALTAAEQAEPCKNPDCGCMFPRDCPSEPNWDGEPAPAARSGAVKVKALDWRGTDGVWHKAYAEFGGLYRITEYPGMAEPFKLETHGWWEGLPCGLYKTLDAAKTAAQADYERRILSALEPAEPEVMCVGCEGKPSLGNSPCAVCGKQAAEPATDVEPLVWEATTPVYKRYITESKYQKLSPAAKRWYRPYNHPAESRLREALESIANNTCCSGCQEAALVARAALEQGEKEQ